MQLLTKKVFLNILHIIKLMRVYHVLKLYKTKRIIACFDTDIYENGNQIECNYIKH